MSLIAKLGRAALFAVVLVAMGSPAHAGWRKAETDTFIVYSDGSERKLRDMALKLERFDTLLRAHYGLAEDPNPNKLQIFLVQRAQDVARLFGSRRSSVAGFYRTMTEGSFAVGNRDKARNSWEIEGDIVLFHEYAHHFMYRNFTYAWPSWYSEGFAEYVGTTEFDRDGNWKFGLPPKHRADTLIHGTKIRAKTLLEGDLSDMDRLRDVVAVYARGWLLVHMLHSTPEGREKLVRYFQDLDAGMSVEEAAARQFGGFEALDEKLDSYRYQRLTYISSNAPIPFDGMLEITELSDRDSDLLTLKLRRQSGYDIKNVRDALVKFTQDYASFAPAWFELAKAEYELARHNRREAARELSKSTNDKVDPKSLPLDLAPAQEATARLLSLAPEHPRGLVMGAQLDMLALAEAGDFESEKWAQARQAIGKANRLALSDPVPMRAYYGSYETQNVEPTEGASLALEGAFGLVPEVSSIRVDLAYDLARRGEYQYAIEIIEVLANDAHQGRRGRKVLSCIKAMQSGEACDDNNESSDEEDEEGDDDDASHLTFSSTF